jgi:hypothetical protein
MVDENWVRFVKLRSQPTFCRARKVPKSFVALSGVPLRSKTGTKADMADEDV